MTTIAANPPVRPMPDVATAIKAAAESGTLGDVITWDVPAGRDLGLLSLRQALEKNDLDPNAIKDLPNRAAFSRACKDLKESRAIDKVDETKDGVITFQLTHKEIKEDITGRKIMDHDYEAQVFLNTNTAVITCPDKPEIADRARALFDYAMKHRTSGDLTRLIQRLFKHNADLFPLNRKGVAYFVPAMHADFVSKVSGFLTDAIGEELCRLPVPKGNDQANRGVQAAVSRGMERLFEELESAADEWDETTNAKTKERAAEKWEVAWHKLQCYQNYLQGSFDDCKKRAGQAAEHLMKRAMESENEDAGDEITDANDTATPPVAQTA